MQCIKCREMLLSGLAKSRFCHTLLLGFYFALFGLSWFVFCLVFFFLNALASRNNRNVFIKKEFSDHVLAKENLKCT